MQITTDLIDQWIPFDPFPLGFLAVLMVLKVQSCPLVLRGPVSQVLPSLQRFHQDLHFLCPRTVPVNQLGHSGPWDQLGHWDLLGQTLLCLPLIRLLQKIPLSLEIQMDRTLQILPEDQMVRLCQFHLCVCVSDTCPVNSYHFDTNCLMSF